MEQTAIDPRVFRTTMGRFATGVTVVSTVYGGQVHGMTANAFMSVSLDPPLVLVSIGHKARMHHLLAETGWYGVSVLCEEQQPISAHFGGRPVEGLSPCWTWKDGMPLLDNATAYVIARVVDTIAAGDHTLYLGHVTLVEHTTCAGRPLLFHSGAYNRLAA
jgi:flavin reductase (DIM6/NTAB) family NADH-FMN oxidoreductase RutF